MIPVDHVRFIRQRIALLPVGPSLTSISLCSFSGPGDLRDLSFFIALSSSAMVNCSSKMAWLALGAFSLAFSSFRSALSFCVSFEALLMEAKCAFIFSAFFWLSIMHSFSKYIGLGFSLLSSPLRLLRRLQALAPSLVRSSSPVVAVHFFFFASLMASFTLAQHLLY